MKNPFLCLLAIAALSVYVEPLRAAIIYNNDFQSNTNGFTASGSLSSFTLASLPTDSGGLGSANKSTWLGRLGLGVPKSNSQSEIASLNLTGLVANTEYNVAFDLFIGGSWDGSASGQYGPDTWRLTVDGKNLVNTTFTNGNAGQEYGAYSPQRYSDTTYMNTLGPDFPKFSGADAFFTTGTTLYAQHYAIYGFGHGAGNPVLTFKASSSVAALAFVRYGNTTDSSDEYWALDNVQVTGQPVSAVPEPTSLSLCALGIACSAIAANRRRRSLRAKSRA